MHVQHARTTCTYNMHVQHVRTLLIFLHCSLLQTFLGFTRAVTGLDERRRKIEAIVSGEPETKKGDKKDLKGKKK